MLVLLITIKVCILVCVADLFFLSNFLLLLLSIILLRINLTKFILLLFFFFLVYCLYVLYYVKISMMFDFFWSNWIVVVAYSFVIITFISLMFTIIVFNSYIYHYLLFLLVIYFSAYTLLFTNSLLIFLISYESLLLPAFYILYKFAKTYRCVEAAYVMLFWTQFGAIILICLNIYIMLQYNVYHFNKLFLVTASQFDRNLLFLFLFISFGVKMPIWPFHLWLPKAHAEAPTNFSIFLSGVLVKLAFIAFIKFIFYAQFVISCWYVFVWLVVGIFDVSMRLFYQVDLKKIIAFTTVVEMHWLVLVLLQSNTIAYISSILMIISHAVMSSLFFLLTDSISRRFHTRYTTELSSLWLFAPNLTTIILLTNILFLGFPCTSFFWAEVFLFLYLIELNLFIYGFLLFLLFLSIPIILFRFWIQIMYGNLAFKMLYIPHKFYNKKCYDINKTELIIYIFLLLHLVVIGLYPTIILY